MKKQQLEQHVSTVKEFLVFTSSEGDVNIDVRVVYETVWLTQKLIALLYGVGIPTINEYLKNIYAEGELKESSTIRKFRIVQMEGMREVSRTLHIHNDISLRFIADILNIFSTNF